MKSVIQCDTISFTLVEWGTLLWSSVDAKSYWTRNMCTLFTIYGLRVNKLPVTFYFWLSYSAECMERAFYTRLPRPEWSSECPPQLLELLDISSRVVHTDAWRDKVKGLPYKLAVVVCVPILWLLKSVPDAEGLSVPGSCWSVSRCGGATVTSSPWISGTARSPRCPMRSTATAAVWRSCFWTQTNWESCLR